MKPRHGARALCFRGERVVQIHTVSHPISSVAVLRLSYQLVRYSNLYCVALRGVDVAWSTYLCSYCIVYYIYIYMTSYKLAMTCEVRYSAYTPHRAALVEVSYHIEQPTTERIATSQVTPRQISLLASRQVSTNRIDKSHFSKKDDAFLACLPRPKIDCRRSHVGEQGIAVRRRET